MMRPGVLLSTLLAAHAARAEEPKPAGEPAKEATTEVAPSTEVISRGLSWDLIGGGVPAEGALAELSLGFSGLPRLGYHLSLSPEMSVGGALSFDYAYWAPDAAFTAGLLAQGVVRYAVMKSDNMTIGVRGEPGLGLFFTRGDPTFVLLLNLGVSLGFTVENRLIVGGGVDLPVALAINNGVDLVFPILIGPALEFHVTPPLALTLDLKMGPQFHSTSGIPTLFGLKVMAGLAYRL